MIAGAMAERITSGLASALRGEDVAWASLDMSATDWLAACDTHGVTTLVARRLRAGDVGGDWPVEVCRAMRHAWRAAVAAELSVAADVAVTIEALADAGLTPILFKGTALAYSVYESPELRPRGDTDVIIRGDDRETVRSILTGLGYTAPLSCDELFGQRRYVKDTPLGVSHAIDVHWRISTQTVFAEFLTYDELATQSIAIPALSPRARAAGAAHALLLACVHPVMHHRNVELLIWVHDVHLLLSAMPAARSRHYADLAIARGVSAICATQVRIARARLGTVLPEPLMSALTRRAAPEATAAYLMPGRRWHHELLANLRGASSWRARCRLLRDVLLPDQRYMLRTYGVSEARWGALLLPVLHLHRLAAGAAKVVIGWK